jgi:hypothetical protein
MLATCIPSQAESMTNQRFTLLICTSDECNNRTTKHERKDNGTFLCLRCGRIKHKYKSWSHVSPNDSKYPVQYDSDGCP